MNDIKNKLLIRQIKRNFGNESNIPESLKSFLKIIDETYFSYESDIELLQNSIEISSTELRTAYQKQIVAIDTQSKLFEKIREAIFKLNDEEIVSDNCEYHRNFDSDYLINILLKHIGEKKAVEIELRKLSQAVEQSSASIVITNLKGEIEYVNPKFTESTGYSPEEAIGKNPRILKSGKQTPEYYKELWTTIISGKVWRGEFHNKKKNGELYWESASISAIYTEEGKFTHFLAIKDDITIRKQYEEELKLAKEQAEAASKAKSEFLSNMSHEIRTPLNGVIGFTDLLRNTPLTHVQQQYVDNANVSGHTLLGIINDILDFSKIEAGMLHLEMIKTDMIELLENSVDIVKYSSGKKNLELLLDIDPLLPRFAVTDPIRLKQILANLLGNAVKFTEKGEVELKVIYEPIENNQGRILFEVRDTGIGISESQKVNLFKSFSQADSSVTRKYGGTGLGLTISNLIAQKMNSNIQYESKQGEGSVFFFDIVTDTAHGEKADTGSIDSIKRCLIIDDNENNRHILEHMLAGWNIECESCDNGLTALKLIETRKPFDVIICDYNMPYIDGLETIRLIRDKLNLSKDNQPVILLHSSSDDERLHKQCDDLGVRFRLTKPVKSKDLFSYLCQVHSDDFKNSKLTIDSDSEIMIMDNGSKILIVEDVLMNMIMIKAIIKQILPHSLLIEAKNGIEAVNLYEQHKPDLVFMDIQMPEMNGIDATKEIRKFEIITDRYVPIIALTAGAFNEEQERCLAAGMNDFLSKPVEVQKIREMLNKHL
jgi:PAS domain S-box-containing protein